MGFVMDAVGDQTRTKITSSGLIAFFRNILKYIAMKIE